MESYVHKGRRRVEIDARLLEGRHLSEDMPTMLESCVSIGVPNSRDADEPEDSKLVQVLKRDRFVLRQVNSSLKYARDQLAITYVYSCGLQDRTLWITGENAAFKQLLENGLSEALKAVVIGVPPLVIISDLPMLDDPHVEMMSHAIDEMLDEGWEVIVCSMPSHDLLGPLQRDRVLVSPRDLDGDAGLGHRSVDGRGLLSENVQKVAFIFNEELDSRTRVMVLFMLALGSGSFADLMRVSPKMNVNDLRWLAVSFPVLGIDFEAMRFSTCIDSDTLFGEAISTGVMDGSAIGYDAARPLLGLLMGRRRIYRAFLAARALMQLADRRRFVIEHLGEFLDAISIDGASTQLRPLLIDGGGPSSAFSSDADDDFFKTSERAFGVIYQASMMLNEGCFEEASLQALCMLGLIRDDPESGGARSRQDIDLEAGVIASLGVIWLLGIAPMRQAALTPRNTSRSDPADLSAYQQASQLIVRAFNRMRDEPLYASAAVLFAQAITGKPVLKRAAGKAYSKIRNVVGAEGGYARTRLALHFMCAALSAGMALGVRANAVWHHDMTVALGELIDGALASSDPQARKKFTAMLLISDQELLAVAPMSGWMLPPTHRSQGAERDSARVDAMAGQGSIGMSREADATLWYPSYRTEEPPEVRVNLLGGFEILVDGVSVEASAFARRKGREALALLAMRRGREISRDQFAAMLWPEASESSRLTSLYSTWGALREAMIAATGLPSCPYLIRSGLLYRVDARYVSSDIEEFDVLTRHLLKGDSLSSGPERYREAQDERARLYIANVEAGDGSQPAARIRLFDRIDDLYSGELLEAVGEMRIGEFTPEAIRDRMIQAMLEAADYAAGLGMKRHANWYAMRALEVGGKKEEVYRARMKAQMDLGQRSGALETFLQMRSFLHEQQGVGPSLASAALYQDILADDIEQAIEDGDADACVAVLPEGPTDAV